MLTGTEIMNMIYAGKISIDPNPTVVGPNSVDCTLHDVIVEYAPAAMREDGQYLDMKIDNPVVESIIPTQGMIFYPGRVYIASTRERISTNYFVPCVEGRSSVARLGISIHSTAGICDIGFDGRITLEITVAQAVKIYSGCRIAQLLFFAPVGSRDIRYKGKYQYQKSPTPSRMWKDWIDDDR